MGIYTWTLSNILTPKFWTLVRKEGFIRTYIRGHKAERGSQYIGGHEGPVKCVGQDEFGNRYFEDFAVDHRWNRRWVEYANHFYLCGIGTDRVPPPWNGWLSYTYSDVPTEGKNFVKPFYFKPHKVNQFLTHNAHVPPGNISPFNNKNRNDFIESFIARKYTNWEPRAVDSSTGKGFQLKSQNNYVVDSSENY